MEILDYFNPLSNKFDSIKDFENLTFWQKIGTIAVTALAALVLVISAVAAFRSMVEKYTFKIVDKDDPKPNLVNNVAQEILESPQIKSTIEPEPEVELKEIPAGLKKPLEMLQQIAKGTPEQGWVSFAVSYLPKRFQAPTPLETDAEWVQTKLQDALKGARKFLDQAAVEGTSRDDMLPALKTFRDALLNGAKAIETMKQEFINTGNEDGAEAMNALLEECEQMIALLPEKPQINYLQKLYGAIQQSKQQDDIQWKVAKYEKQISNFLEFLKSPVSKLELSLSDSIAELFKSVVNVVKFSWAEHFQKGLTELLSTDKDRFNQNYLGSLRKGYQHFIGQFRQALRDHVEDAELLEIAEMIYTTGDLQMEAYDTLKLFDRLGSNVLGNTDLPEDPVERVHVLHTRLGAVPYSAKAPLLNQWGNSARGQWNRNFDPFLQGNPVHVLYNFWIGEKQVKALGMGTPTIEDYQSKAELTPEFTAFIHSYKKKGKRHLYVNNQNMIPKKGFFSYFLNGDETNRCKLILEAQNQEGMKGALFAISLAKNTKFYAQSGEYKEANQTEIFKTTLLTEVFDKDPSISGCFIPKTVRDEIPDLKETAIAMINQIHKTMFDGKEALTQEERRIFIELFYDELTKHLIKKLNIDSFNISCKDAIDRGAGSNAQLFANCTLSLGDLDQARRNKIEVLMLVRALFVRKRPPLMERVERFGEGYGFYLKNRKKLAELHQALYGDNQIVPV